jgi:ubiquinone/menaquinone biosynthesis C-methylase UbiE
MPSVYRWLQRGLAIPGARHEVASTYIRAQSGDRVLDIGCGPADVLEYLPEARYIGIDSNAQYLHTAQRRYREHRPCPSFVQMDVRALRPRSRRFDIVLAQGLLHHFDDGEAQHLLTAAAESLSDTGRLITIDPAFDPAQSPIARLLIANDRGKHVRPVTEYRRLAGTAFEQVTTHVRHNLMRVPYTHVIMVCVTPRSRARQVPAAPHSR